MNNSALKTLEILELISKADKPLGISEISRELGYPKSSVFDIVSALTAKGYAELANPELKTYKIGLKAYQTGSSYINKAGLYKTAHPILEELKNRTGETVYLAVENQGLIIYLDKVESSAQIRSTCNIGSQNYMHLTGLGKAILAGYDRERVRQITQGRLEVRTKNTISTYEGLTRELELVRDNGFAVDRGEDLEIVRCVAAPVRDMTGEVIAAISVSMLDINFTQEKLELTGRLVTGAALDISHRMGYIRDNLY